MNSITGELKMLGKANVFNQGTTYSVIEIGVKHLTDVSVSSGLDNYLQSAIGKECTLHLSRSKAIVGVDVDGKSYALKGGSGTAAIACILAGFFSLVCGLFCLMNLGDLVIGRKGDAGNMFGGLIFGVLTVFAVRAFVRNAGVIKRLGAVRSRPGVIEIVRAEVELSHRAA
jgi:hypothetical protein